MIWLWIIGVRGIIFSVSYVFFTSRFVFRKSIWPFSWPSFEPTELRRLNLWNFNGSIRVSTTVKKYIKSKRYKNFSLSMSGDLVLGISRVFDSLKSPSEVFWRCIFYFSNLKLSFSWISLFELIRGEPLPNVKSAFSSSTFEIRQKTREIISVLLLKKSKFRNKINHEIFMNVSSIND